MREAAPSWQQTVSLCSAPDAVGLGEWGYGRCIKKFLPRLWARVTGFKAQPPQEPIPAKCVVIAFPHTTNWDFFVCLHLVDEAGVEAKWLGKQQLFRGPMGPLMRALGGVSVQRSSSQGLVTSLAAEFDAADELRLVVPAEGTRSAVEYWKSGFYRIAMAAKVPIVLAYVDGRTKTGGFGPVIMPTGDVRADMDRIRAFYDGKTGLKASNANVPRLREEDEPVLGTA